MGQFLTKKERQQKVEKATGFLEWATTEKEIAYAKYQDYVNSTAALDFMTYDSDEVRRKGEELEDKYKSAVLRVENARKELWSAKYDTMSAQQLQVALAEAEDDEERAYIEDKQNKQVAEQRERDLKIMLQRGKPESVLYDPDFLEKSEYRSTKLTDGSWGESDTGYADIDYEFINGNPEISELIVGLDRNYRYISDYERQVYNYWYNYDREHGTNVADNYLNLLQETLNDRDSAEDFAKIEGKTALELAYGFQSGLSQWGNDVNNWILQPEGYIPMTSMEMTSGRIYDDMADVGDFLTIDGKSIGQLGYTWMEDQGYNLPGTLVAGAVGKGGRLAGVLTDTGSKLTETLIKGVFASAATNGKIYRERINQGNSMEQAKQYANDASVDAMTSEYVSMLAGAGLEALWNKLPSNSVTDTIGKILNETDWLGATKALESAITGNVEAYTPGSTVSGNNTATEKARKTAQAVVTAKGLEKIIKQTQGNVNEISPDLREALLESLKDPAIRTEVENTGLFTSTQLDEVTAKLETAETGSPGLGTYIGNAAYGPNGYTINRQMLQQWADQAVRQRGMYANDPMGKALYERYKNLR